MKTKRTITENEVKPEPEQPPRRELTALERSHGLIIVKGRHRWLTPSEVRRGFIVEE